MPVKELADLAMWHSHPSTTPLNRCHKLGAQTEHPDHGGPAGSDRSRGDHRRHLRAVRSRLLVEIEADAVPTAG